MLLAAFGVAQAKAIHIEGAITAIDYTVKTIVVNDITIYANDATVILICKEVGTFDDLQVDQVVKVTYTLVDGQPVAKKICAKCNAQVIEP